MGPKRSLERVIFSLKSPFLRGVEQHVLGLKCHSSGCNFWLEWFIWINATWKEHPKFSFGDGGPDRCSLGPKRSLERVLLSLKSPFLRGVERYVLGLQCDQSDCNSGWNGSYGSMGPEGYITCVDLVMRAMPGAHWVRSNCVRKVF